MLCKLFQKKNQSRTREKNVSMGIFFFSLQMTENENQIDLSQEENLLPEVYGLMYGFKYH